MTYTYADLCALFQLSPTSNRMRKRLKQMSAHGFPPPLPGGGRWSKPAVDHWLANWSGEAPATAPEPSHTATITNLQQQLQRIYN